ncbi:DNA polymerase-like protein iota [Phyllosticta citribraziliensis]|uniref:DNA polymerase-like protein iota n=1 Tax=Phyllosticta citribraziliensis TaxID=989973 RepID=A0ABR1LGJ5_9PEZI
MVVFHQVIVLGEDLTRFRDASKQLYRLVRAFSWNGRVERLGFDELWLDVTDQIDYNIALLNPHGLAQSFFHLSRDDPTHGFAFDATGFAGTTFPSLTGLSTATESPSPSDITQTQDSLTLRLLLASHLARFLRNELEHHKNFTATAGISTNKLLSKLVGNLNKPNGQTTLLPPYFGVHSNVIAFVDSHDIGKIPGIGFKSAQKLREFVLHRPAAFDDGLVYGGTRETVKVGDIRKHPDLNVETLEKLLGGPGSPHGIGVKVWGLLHGADHTEVRAARDTPKQISIEDSYLRLDSFDQVVKELRMLAISLLKRMHADLLEEEDEYDQDGATPGPDSFKQAQAERPAGLEKRRWIAHPATLRLSTRPRPPLNADGTRTRTFARISRSAPVPNFLFSLSTPIESLAERLVNDALLPLFRRLHPEKTGWNLSLVNVAVTNMAEAGSNAKSSSGRDITSMFRKQAAPSIPSEPTRKLLPADDVPKMDADSGAGAVAADQDSREKLGHVADGASSPMEEPAAPLPPRPLQSHDSFLTDFISPDARTGSEDLLVPIASKDSRSDVDGGELDDFNDGSGGNGDADDLGLCECDVCGATMPAWALAGHARFHAP